MSATSSITADTMGPTADELLDRARGAHESVSGEPGRALAFALDAGDALIAAKALVVRGQWTKRLKAIGIPSSTARLYMRLAEHRALIGAAGCTSIRQARTLITQQRTDDDAPEAPRRPRPGRRSSYEEGYREGYRVGLVDGYGNGFDDGWVAGKEDPTRKPEPTEAAGGPPSKADLKWALKRLHPDVVDEAGKERAHRVAVWLNAVNADRSDTA